MGWWRSWSCVITIMTVRPSFSSTSPLPNVKTFANAHIPDLIGNVYVRFKYEEDAQKACDALNSRWYAGRPIYCELSPVTDFREACCRLNSGEGCVRGGFCNFIHRKEPTAELDRELDMSTRKWLKERGRDARSMSKSPTPPAAKSRF
jgi:splicing factor U2AF subunit